MQGGSQTSADLYAREALSHWRVLIGQPGCWDPFVLRHAEVIAMEILACGKHIFTIQMLYSQNDYGKHPNASSLPGASPHGLSRIVKIFN